MWHKALLYDGPCVVSVEEYKFLWNAEQDREGARRKEGSNRDLYRIGCYIGAWPSSSTIHRLECFMYM